MPWKVVHFVAENQVREVTEGWLNEDGTCYWPHNIRSEVKLHKYIVEERRPSDKWRSYSVKILVKGKSFGEFHDYLDDYFLTVCLSVSGIQNSRRVREHFHDIWCS